MPLSILTCSQHFTDLALNELKRHISPITPLSELAPGCLLFHSPLSFESLSRPWRHRLPIYLHHLCPVDFSVPLQGTLADLATLQEVTKAQIGRKFPLLVQPRILTETAELAVSPPCYSVDDLITGLSRVVRTVVPAPEIPSGRILSVVIVPDGTRWRAYMGVSWADQNLSPWPGGVRPCPVEMPNRAGYKLLEALETFKIELPTERSALDLGAAPGAWTLVLRQRGLQVTAVSPDPLYFQLRKDRGVSHRQMEAELYLHQVEGVFDFITNDMRMAAQDSARLMVDYAQYLRPQGLAIMTLKLRQRNQSRVMDHSFRILRKAYQIIRVRQLVSNRKEVTLFLQKRKE
jgi:23S rRNA (cytidine2498-2'-O)-methyltransferase